MTKPTFSPQRSRPASDGGFTMIEMVVVVTIIGVLVAIAIPLYGKYRTSAENKSAKSDVRGAVVLIEQCFTDNGNAYPAGGGALSPAATGPLVITCAGSPVNISISSGNALKLVTVGTPITAYKVLGTHVGNGKNYCYSSTVGGDPKDVGTATTC